MPRPGTEVNDKLAALNLAAAIAPEVERIEIFVPRVIICIGQAPEVVPGSLCRDSGAIDLLPVSLSDHIHRGLHTYNREAE